MTVEGSDWVWAHIFWSYPEHRDHDGWWVEAGTVVCACGSVLFHIDVLPDVATVGD